MPSHIGSRPLKRWRYVGVYTEELMVCIAAVRIGPARQAFWAVWDRTAARLYERTSLGRGDVHLAYGTCSVRHRDVQLGLTLDETDGVETVSRTPNAYAWTRKQGGIPMRGVVMLEGVPRAIDGRGVIDDTAAYYERHTQWRWSAGVGTLSDGRLAAWNLVDGVNDAPQHSERTVWVDGEPAEVPQCTFAPDLSAVDELRFSPEATRRRRENLLIIRSDYVQPFGTFAGRLPGGLPLAEGFGVMEEHDVWW